MQNLEKARKLCDVKDSESDTWKEELKNSLDQVKMYGPDTEIAGALVLQKLKEDIHVRRKDMY